MDFVEDIRLVDGPVLWAAWVAGAAGLAYLLWWRAGPAPRARLLRTAAAAVACTLGAVALVAFVHWLLIYVFAVFPAVLPLDVLAWSVPAVGALLLLVLRLAGIWRGTRAARRGLNPGG